MKYRSILIPSLLIALGTTFACDKKSDEQPKPAEKSETETVNDLKLDRLNRNEFNQAALRLNIPLYWTLQDNAETKDIKPEYLVKLLFYPQFDLKIADDKGAFTQEFKDLYEKLVAVSQNPVPEGADEAESKRIKGLVKELESTIPTVVASDLSGESENEKNFIKKMLEVADAVDELYGKQIGAAQVASQIPESDTISRSVFRRNWGPQCESPLMKDSPECTAMRGQSGRLNVGVYPASVQKDADFCKILSERPDADSLLTPFTVVIEGSPGMIAPPDKKDDGKKKKKSKKKDKANAEAKPFDGPALKTIPYNEAYKDDMTKIANLLKQASEIAAGLENEQALKNYLDAASAAFLDNNWEKADEAWAKMNSENSKWYVRVAPDETYWEPCSRKAGFHADFARVNSEGVLWQQKLAPHAQKMENDIAKLAGKPYKARKISVQMPDFIDIIFNSGDSRNAVGATIGQSLPNWGPVANEGRGRTMVMYNLYTDPDNLIIKQNQARSLFTEESMQYIEGGTTPSNLNTILHELTHNFGPSHEYEIKGKTDDQIFGGALATLAEELKAQTGALYLTKYLLKNAIISENMSHQLYADSVQWAMSQISRGMTSGGNILPYPQLAAIHVGFLMEKGALSFDKEATAANGTDKGAFVIHIDKFPAASEELMQMVAAVKASGNVAELENMRKKYVENPDLPIDLIKERVTRSPKASFVYSVKWN